MQFQHTAARRRLRLQGFTKAQAVKVSTHSRAEAAAPYSKVGGNFLQAFQHTAARRRLLANQYGLNPWTKVSTHSRAEAAA